ncbi:MAG: LEPR-XLL domain-containing protein [Planctomycetota bacterium]
MDTDGVEHAWADRARPPAFEALEPRRLLSAGPVISEVMAINDSVLADGDGVVDLNDFALLKVHFGRS